jgi:small-conductance mechanosensitive channel
MDSTLIGFNPTIALTIIETLVIVLILWVIRLAILHFAKSNIKDVRTIYHLHKTSAKVVVVLALLLLMPVWGLNGLQTLGTFLGLLSASLVLVLKDPLLNLAGWIFLIWRRSFQVGDRIQVGGNAGDVIDIRLFQFSLLEIGHWVGAEQSTGRVLHIPNGKLFSEAVANYTAGFEYIWNEIPVLLTFESDWEQAKTILQCIADEESTLPEDAAESIRQASERYMIVYSKLTPIVYTKIEQNGVLLTIRYLCGVRRRRGTQQVISEKILKAFAQHPEIEFAYPTYRFYQRHLEPFKLRTTDPGASRSYEHRSWPGTQ